MDISFFTPIKWVDPTSELKPNLTFKQKICQAAESYLYLGGRIAVVIPNMMRDGKHLVTLKEHKSNIWLLALKVASFVFIILPALAFITKAIFRYNHQFQRFIAEEPIVPPPVPPKPVPIPDDCPNRPILNDNYLVYEVVDRPDGRGGILKAPLTLIRSPEQTSLKISILYNQKFLPIDPTEPKPSEIVDLLDTQQTSKHTWQVITQGDGTLALQDERHKKINMIWWEAKRAEVSKNLTAAESVCIKREDVRDFLMKALRKQGVKNQEMEAFVHYWETVLANDYSVTSPYLLVKLVDSSQFSSFLPEMQVEGEKAKDYVINRFYFCFEPISQPPADNISSVKYLESLAGQDLGERAVIDLGGEVNAPSNWKGQDAFNANFIRKYIYAN